jgi:hypothetical protein
MDRLPKIQLFASRLETLAKPVVSASEAVAGEITLDEELGGFVG